MGLENQAGLNSFILTAKRWIETTNAIGLISKAGRYGGTYAHKDIAFEFASWISRRVQVVSDQGIPAAQGRRTQTTWLGYPAQSDQDQLPDSYRRDQREPDPAGTDSEPDEPDLCLGGGCSEHGSIRHDRQGMARQPSGRERAIFETTRMCRNSFASPIWKI